MSYLLTIAATHFIDGDAPKGHPSLSCKGTDGSQEFVKMIKNACPLGNKKFYPIHQSLLSSSDGTTLFICPRKISKKKKNGQILVSYHHDNSTQIYYKEEELEENVS
jgi:hypothetical protein